MSLDRGALTPPKGETLAVLSDVGGQSRSWKTDASISVAPCSNLPSATDLNRHDGFFDSRYFSSRDEEDAASRHGILPFVSDESDQYSGSQMNSVIDFRTPQSDVSPSLPSPRSGTITSLPQTRVFDSRTPLSRSPRRSFCSRQSEGSPENSQSAAHFSDFSGFSASQRDGVIAADSEDMSLPGFLLWETPSVRNNARREWLKPEQTVSLTNTSIASLVQAEGGKLATTRSRDFPFAVLTPVGTARSPGQYQKSPQRGQRRVLQRSAAPEEESQESERVGRRRLARYCSTGSLLNTTGTMVAPNTRKLISSVATILLDQMAESQNTVVDELPEFQLFDEEQYLVRDDKRPGKAAFSERCCQAPDKDEISDFITSLYETAEFSPECNILCLLYINRLMAFTGMPLLYRNWRPLVFTALILAQKVWDDKFLGNSEFAKICPFFTTEEINRMEAAFLKLVQYEVVVKPSTYAQYYFELRSMCQDGEIFSSQHPKDVESSSLENRST